MKDRKQAPPAKGGIPRLPSRLVQAATGSLRQNLDPSRLTITPVKIEPEEPKKGLHPSLVQPAAKRKRAQPPRRRK